MSEQKLDILLEGINELFLVTREILDRKDKMIVKLDVLIMEVRQIKTDIAVIRQDLGQLKNSKLVAS
ncbi:hypothetical protein HPY31_22915 [Brevibacillus sp. HB1.3]|uniref:hypothetical protein n=1 Tax=Brevibacillus sp. HB1.3 TaxID=2738842 RepID=UPI0015581D31|nr:hypothetical protein [Brevibacillus sp. HB1.3]NQF16730.1 hypothetical protein [Brevibacillus sp. HB1.3]